MTDEICFSTGAQSVARWSGATPDAVAVIDHDETFSYSTLSVHMLRAAVLLRSAGLRPGMILGIQCDAHYKHLVLLLACEIIGATHWSIERVELLFDPALATRCDILCAETMDRYATTHKCVIELPSCFIDDLDRIDAAGIALGETQSPDALVHIARTS